MRQGQQNRRGRGRGRKVQNPLSRNYESNGPEVKIRGNASHIAEKYSALARDALASGDTVTAENYLQHAEHYHRIIMAAQAQNPATAAQPADGANGAGNSRSQPDAPQEEAEAAAASESDGSGEATVEAAKANGSTKSDTSEKSDKGDKSDDDAKSSDGAPSDNAAA